MIDPNIRAIVAEWAGDQPTLGKGWVTDEADHHTVGHLFNAHGHTYYCDSWQPNAGYWMTPVNVSAAGWLSAKRTNVSERAINATFHRVYHHTPYPNLTRIRMEQEGAAHV